jgi:hypothetical protein
MSTIYKWKLYCITEASFVYGYSNLAPTTCYNNPAHTINPNSISLVDSPTYETQNINRQLDTTFYTPIANITFSGTNVIVLPYKIQVLISGKSSLTTLRLMNITNNSIVGTLSTSTTDTPTYYDLTLTTGNLSTDLSNLELQGFTSIITDAPYIQSIVVTYYTQE